MDVKPTNIVIGKGFITKLVDFGETYIHREEDEASFDRTGLDRREMETHAPGTSFAFSPPELYRA